MYFKLGTFQRAIFEPRACPLERTSAHWSLKSLIDYEVFWKSFKEFLEILRIISNSMKLSESFSVFLSDDFKFFKISSNIFCLPWKPLEVRSD